MKPGVPFLPSRDDFEDRVAIVTGGTNGLGRHLAGALVELGAEVWFCGRNVAAGRELAERWGARAHFERCDLADAADTRAFVTKVGIHHGHVDYLVNNAAIDPVVPFELSTLEEFDRVVATNLRSYFVASQTALPFLKTGRGRAIVNLGTTNWMIGLPNYTMYAAAKSGIVGFTRSLAHDVGPYGIRANIVSPGWIMTERQLAEKVTPAIRKQLARETAIGRTLDDEHVTPATLFLLSSAAAGISGQNLVVDGGKYLQ